MTDEKMKHIYAKQQIDVENRSKYFQSLFTKQEILLNQQRDLLNKMADLAICHMQQGMSQRQNSIIPALPSKGTKCMNPNLMTGLACGAVVLETIKTVTDAISFHNRTSVYSSDKKTLEKQLEEVQNNLEDVAHEINNELGMGHKDLPLDSGFKLTITDVHDDMD